MTFKDFRPYLAKLLPAAILIAASVFFAIAELGTASKASSYVVLEPSVAHYPRCVAPLQQTPLPPPSHVDVPLQ